MSRGRPIEGRRRTTAVVWLYRLALPLGALALFLPSMLVGMEATLSGVEAKWLGAAMVCYALGHGVRAVRLAVIAVPLMALRARTLILLHIHTVPISFVLPYKLGELYRLQQLISLSGYWGRAVLVLLVERFFDALILTALCGVLVLSNWSLPRHLSLMAEVLATAIATVVIVFSVVHPALRALQGYIFRKHVSPNACEVLKAISSLHAAISLADHCLRNVFFLLLLLSVMIWACEALALSALISSFTSGGITVLLGTIGMALTPDMATVSGYNDDRLYRMISLIVLLTAWPIGTLFYFRALPPVLRNGAKADTLRPLSMALPPRRVRQDISRSI